MTIYTYAPPPLYCEKCGAKCVDTWLHSRYDPTDGNELFHVRTTCPNHVRIWDGHTHEYREEAGFEYCERSEFKRYR